MNKQKRKIFISTFISFLALSCFSNCKKKEEANNYLHSSKDEITIGTKTQRWKFEKEKDGWKFKGIYARENGKDTLVFLGTNGKINDDDQLEGNGCYFSLQGYASEADIGYKISNLIDQIEVVKDDSVKQIKLTGKGFTSYLTVEENSEYLEREMIIQVDSDTTISEAEISFCFKTQVDCFSETGYILSHSDEDDQYTLPYSFPGVISKLTSLQDSSTIYALTDVIDYYETDPLFRNVRRKQNLNGYFEIGSLSLEGVMTAKKDYRYKEYITLEKKNISFYDMIYQAKKKYNEIYPLPVEEVAATNGNMTVSSWEEACQGAIEEIIDKRGRPFGDTSIWGPYGYNNGGSEAFGSMNILKGTIRYALATDDQELLATLSSYLKKIVTPDSTGKSYIMPLSNYKSQYTNENYFYRSYSGTNYNPLDPSYTDNEDVFGSFKYYSRCSQLGELGILTGIKEVKEAYLSLMPFISMCRGENYEQDIQWNFDGTPCNYDFENGGSSGAEAMWAYCMYIASLITGDEKEKEQYLTDMKKALDVANKQDFNRTSALREYPKPESLGYLVKMNLVVYEMTKESSYLNYAIKNARAVYFYYFQDTHPYTYYQTVGYGYACAKERWEAFMEMVETIVLILPILQYDQETMFYDLIYAMQNSALWTLPINGYPDGYLGGHSDWLDALYIPFEQPTATMGDNALDSGGDQSWKRHSKELYGAGELFTGNLSFEVYGNSSDPYVSLIHYTAGTTLQKSLKTLKFKLYNVKNEPIDTILTFPHLSDGKNYDLTIGGISFGTFSARQLANGIRCNAKGRTPTDVVVSESNTTTSTIAPSDPTTAEIKTLTSSSATILADGENVSHFKVEVSSSLQFLTDFTTISYEQKQMITLSHEANEKYYARITGIDKNGNALHPAIVTIQSPIAKIGVIEDFNYINSSDGSIGSWEATSLYNSSKIALITDTNDFAMSDEYGGKSSGYMAVYKPNYAGYDRDCFINTYLVNLTSNPFFEFYPYTKNLDSRFSLNLIIDGTTYSILHEVTTFDQHVYRVDLSKLSSSLSGEKKVQVQMISEGFNRGFAISQFRFFDEIDYTGSYLISALQYQSVGAVIKDHDYLSLTNKENMDDVSANVFHMNEINLAEYQEISFNYIGVTSENSGMYKAIISLYEEGTETPLATINQQLRLNDVLKMDISTINKQGMFYIESRFETRFGNEEVNDVSITAIRLNSDQVVATYETTKLSDDGKTSILNDWSANWAFSDESGYIYNGNPNVQYGSIYKEGIQIDLDKNPVLKFVVSDIRGDAQFTLKCNDNSTMQEDLALINQTASKGTYTINLKEKLKMSGIITLRLDFYIIADYGQQNGVKFDRIQILKSTTVYENLLNQKQSITTSSSFLVDLDMTPYLFVDIASLTYGEACYLYIEYEGQIYELKTKYEAVYGKMYTREKIGAFKYDLRDILPDDIPSMLELKLIIKLTSENAEVTFRTIRLCDNNEVPHQNHIAFIQS